jgi:hypothetical protein
MMDPTTRALIEQRAREMSDSEIDAENERLERVLAMRDAPATPRALPARRRTRGRPKGRVIDPAVVALFADELDAALRSVRTRDAENIMRAVTDITLDLSNDWRVFIGVLTALTGWTTTAIKTSERSTDDHHARFIRVAARAGLRVDDVGLGRVVGAQLRSKKSANVRRRSFPREKIVNALTAAVVRDWHGSNSVSARTVRLCRAEARGSKLDVLVIMRANWKAAVCSGLLKASIRCPLVPEDVLMEAVAAGTPF